jgi:hypothetical protein
MSDAGSRLLRSARNARAFVRGEATEAPGARTFEATPVATAPIGNRRLDPNELSNANELLHQIRTRLALLSGGDADLLFAYRRKIAKELTYDERSKPMDRRRLKAAKRLEQHGLCPICNKAPPLSYNVLDRTRAADGYTPANTRLICEACDRAVQASRSFT